MSLEAGTRLGPYEIVSLLGAGGMGEVYRARDPRLSREVAVKVLHGSASADLDRRRRFEQEAKVVGSLNHPNLLAVFDIGEHAGATYLVFELLDGTTLRHRVSAGPLPVKKAVDIASQIAHGLAAAHEKGIVHRDLKPENLFVTSGGRVKILDFGLAKLRPELDRDKGGREDPTASAITGAGTVLGTVGYMSPEQVQARPVDHRSDIFSFGAVLHEMLSGTRAFRRDSAVETMNAILKENPPDLSRVGNGIPPTLERILDRCLEKNPDERFRSAHDLAFALDAVSGLSGSGLTATTAAIPRAMVPRRWLLAGAVAIAVVAIALVGPRVRRESGAPLVAPAAAAARVEKLTNRGNVDDDAISPDGRYLAYALRHEARTTIWLRDIVDKAESRLVAPFEGRLGRIRFSRDGRAIYYSFTPAGAPDVAIHKVPLIGGDPQVLHVGGEDAELSPDEKRVAVSRRRGSQWRLFVADAGGTGETEVGEVAPFWLHAWSPDSSELLFGRETDGKFAIFVVKANGSAERKVGELPLAPANASWGPRGRVAISLYSDQYETARLYALDPSTGVTTSLGDRLWQLNVFDWLPDGDALVVSAAKKGHDELYTLSYPGGRVEKFPADTHDYEGLDFTRDGSSVVSIQSTERSDIVVSSDPEGGAFKTVASGTDVEYRMCWTPDGRVVHSSNDGGSYDLYVADADGANRKQLTFDRSSDETQPAASADGRYVVFVSDRSGEQGLFRINRDGTGLRSLTPAPRPHYRDYDPQITPDSQWVLYRHWDNGPTLWKVSIDGGAPILVKGARPVTSPAQVESAYGASMSPDGKSLAFLYFTQDPKSLERTKMVVAVASLDGRIAKTFPYLNTFGVGDNLRVQWSRDGSALYYRSIEPPNVWKQSLAGGPPVQVTRFEEPVQYFDWSFDGKRLAVSRSSTLSDVVMITNFR